ncbi:bifunctional metallophosphatase/5'-nucleotidase [Metabacillus litoralis]|uniref:Bifunctional metallophosphatase/5'-nucleotidase n=1 Tax=Metabacillus litoralis TaxID=152268 RepID=A0A179T0V6_9BACI|nr:bifunctional UDP-sugar hydrolase/5'-nucleotidase [Metabacillus litoralis]OAS86699.1 bifunctional metallophosphatase/5'-nucleotidase [Metabacillus litoralis]
MGTVKITILQTSDIHGNVFPLVYSSNKEKSLGLGKISTIIKNERKKNKNLLLIDNGDLIQGTPLTFHHVKKNQLKINPMITLLNELKYDAAVIGNHEFNYGMSVLEHAVSQSTFPWLSANILHKNTMDPVFGKPYIIKDLEGIKIAVLGVTTHYIPNWENPCHIADLTFEDAFETAKKWVNFIKKNEDPDIMIVSYHGGFERDIYTGERLEEITGENQGYQMCQQINGIDVLLTGHQHRTITETINNVVVVQPSFNGQAIGKVEFLFDKSQGMKIVDKTVTMIKAENTNTDEKLLALVKENEQKTQEWLDQPIGKVVGDMMIKDGFSLRLKEHPIIEFINKVQMDAAGVSISATALFYNESPGIPNQITMRDIVANYIYPNTLKVIRVSGKDIKDALERSAAYFLLKDGIIDVNPEFTHPKPQHYNYDMWEGIEYTFDLTKPIETRVVKLAKDGKSIRMDETFDVVMNNYRAGGGGNYPMFKGKPVIKDIPIDMSELMAEYILKRKIIHAEANHNWNIIWS